jgi:3-phenylpropionate/trans-cinnamate dioxygenase ferredoxin subunit
MTVEGGAKWVEVLPLGRLADQAIRCIRLESVDLLLARDGGCVVACERACPHEQADLGRGRVKGGRLICPRHLASFDLCDGQISAGWPSRPLRLYPVRIEEGRILIDAAAVDSAAD